LKFYKARGDNTIVVAIRGTVPTNAEDLKADASIALGLLERTPRYLNDLRTLQVFQQQYPPAQYDYYGVGHSLGGAILDLFLQNQLLKSGLSYNPAVQPKHFGTELRNQRVYHRDDPLFQIYRPFVRGAEVRQPKKESMFKTLAKKIPFLGKFFKRFDAHRLSNFEGGTRAVVPIIKQLETLNIKPEDYLAEAKKKARRNGLNAETLDFSKNAPHKLVIRDPSNGLLVPFGRVGYGDHFIWKTLEKRGEVPKGHAAQKRRVFRKSHLAIKGDWMNNKYSPNWLAINVLW
jgi:hypothetical protein